MTPHERKGEEHLWTHDGRDRQTEPGAKRSVFPSRYRSR